MLFKAVLWDCDGCLIDSEPVACGLAAKLLTEAGYPISLDDFIRRFCGQGKAHIFGTIEKECGVDYSACLDAPNVMAMQREAFRTQLKPIQGVHETLAQIHLPMAIASGSELERLKYTLSLTQLYDRFKDVIFSSSLVPNGKPHPDIYLYAADKLGVSPQDCLVIEDSLNGVRSGKAAQMTVFGFTGGGHILDKTACGQELLSLGADLVFNDMRDLPRLMAEFTRH